MDVEKTLDEICQLEEEQSQVTVHIRTKVLQEGKKLRQLQKWQKAEQKAAKERGEESQTWKDFVEEQKRSRGSFPGEADCRRYMRISQFPGAYEKGMSVKEAYKHATAWKKNGGKPPEKAKVSINQRLPYQLAMHIGKLGNTLEKLMTRDFDESLEKDGWTADDIAGFQDCLSHCRTMVNRAARKYREAALKAGLEMSDV